MADTNADRNMLLGILALQMDFIDQEQLIAAMHAWVLRKDKSLGEILVDANALAPGDRDLLKPMIERHVQLHDNDPVKSLASVGSVDRSLRRHLEQLGDTALERSLARVAANESSDPNVTRVRSIGDSTSRGVRFLILRPHAIGGLGQVSVARDSELNREVALKEIQSRYADNMDSRTRFVQEAEITGSLEHPGVVPVYGLGRYPDGRPFYAMRFIRGDSLSEAIDRFHKAFQSTGESAGRSLELRKLLGRFVDVCNAIAYAHSRGVLHRDLKPGNVMLAKYGETLVVDWGLAKVVGKNETGNQSNEPTLRLRSGSGSAPTQMGSAIGTPAYMSPEQAAGRVDQLGPASDIYSLGATLYCLLTGQAPLNDTDLATTLRKVEHGDFPAPREVQPRVPKPLEAICLKAMALKQRDRYGSPQELADDVERYLADEPVAAYSDPMLLRARRWLHKHQTFAVATAATSLVAALALTVILILSARGARLEARNARLEAKALSEEKAKRQALFQRRSRVRESLGKGQRFMIEGDWRQAKPPLERASAIADSNPGLEEELAEVEDLLARVNQRLNEQRSRDQDNRRLSDFQGQWREAIFYSPRGPHELLVNRQDRITVFERSRAAAKRALALFSVDDSPSAELTLKNTLEATHFSTDQKKEIRQRCCELLLILADAESRIAAIAEDDPRERIQHALAVLDQAKDLSDQLTQAYHRQRARYLSQLGQEELAAAVLAEAAKLETHPTTASDHFLLGKFALDDQGADGASIVRALEHFEQTLRLEPDHFWAQYLAAVCYLNDRRFSETQRAQLAKVHLLACIAKREDFRGKHLLRGLIESRLNDWPSAEEDFQKVLDEGDTGLQYASLLGRALMHYARDDTRACIQDLERAIQLLPKEYQAYKNLGVVYFKQQNLEQAAKQFDKAIERQPADAELYRERAWIHIRFNEWHEAVAMLERALNLKAESGDYVLKGVALQNLGKYEEAVQTVDLALNQEASSWAYFVRYVLLTKLDRTEEAWESLNSYFRLRNPTSSNRIHSVFESMEARPRVREPGEAPLRYARGLLAAKLGHYAAATSDLTRSLHAASDDIDPVEIRTRRGLLYLELEPLRLAFDDFDWVIQHSPRNGEAYLGRGLARALLADPDAVADAENAVADAEQGLQLNHLKKDRVNLMAARVYTVASQKVFAGLRDRYVTRAVELLQEALDETNSRREQFYEEVIMSDPYLKPIRNTPEFAQLRRR